MESDSRVPGFTESDVMMEDMGNGRPHINRPPEGGISWVQKVSGGGRRSGPRPESVLDDAFVEERMMVEFPDGTDGEPVITIGDEVLNAMNALWKQCFIVKILGKSMSLPIMDRKLRELWTPVGGMSVMDLPRQFFLIRFEKEEEYLSALTGGPWRVFGNYLMVQGWTPDFDATKDEITTTPVWVRLLNLPVNLYHQAILFGIGKGLGNPVKVDLTTLNVERARFARVCVEVNLTKPLKGSIKVNGERYFVTYEGLPHICAGCGIYGHSVHHCPRRRSEQTTETNGGDVSVPNSSEGTQDNGADGFTVVRRKGRSGGRSGSESTAAAVKSGGDQTRNLQEISMNTIMESTGISNQFSLLNDEIASPDFQSRKDTTDQNKENSNLNDQATIGKSVEQGSNFIKFGEMGKGGPMKQNGPNGPKQVKHGPKWKNKSKQRPTSGLVFGRGSDESGRSESGKRLRTEIGSGRERADSQENQLGRNLEGDVSEIRSTNSGSDVGVPVCVQRENAVEKGVPLSSA